MERKAEMICEYVQRVFGSDVWGVLGRDGSAALNWTNFIVYEYLLVHLIHLAKRKGTILVKSNVCKDQSWQE